MISEVTGLHSLTVNSDTWRPSESTKGNRKFENSSFQCIITSKTRARRVAEFPAEGMLRYRIQRQGLPKGVGVKPHTFRAWFCEFLLILLSFLFTCARHFSAHRSSSQAVPVFSILFTTLLNSSSFFSSLPTLAQLFSPLPTSSQLFSTTLTSAHLFSTLLSSSILFSPPATSSQLFPPLLTFAQLISPLSQLISTLFTSCQLFSTLFTGML